MALNFAASTSLDLTRSLEAIFNEAQYTGKLCLANRNLKEFPLVHARFDLSDTCYLDISSNRLVYLPDSVAEFALLETLIASDNKIAAVRVSYQWLTSLTFLDLSGNRLRELPGCICSLPLEILLLSNNFICHLSPQDLPGLKDTLMELDLSSNNLTSLPVEIGALSRLRVLNLRQNFLSELPSEICSLNLTFLDISCNSIAALPIELRHVKSLTHFKLLDNPLALPPATVCKFGPKYVFKSLEIEARTRLKKRKIEIDQCSADCDSVMHGSVGSLSSSSSASTNAVALEVSPRSEDIFVCNERENDVVNEQEVVETCGDSGTGILLDSVPVRQESPKPSRVDAAARSHNGTLPKHDATSLCEIDAPCSSPFSYEVSKSPTVTTTPDLCNGDTYKSDQQQGMSTTVDVSASPKLIAEVQSSVPLKQQSSAAVSITVTSTSQPVTGPCSTAKPSSTVLAKNGTINLHENGPVPCPKPKVEPPPVAKHMASNVIDRTQKLKVPAPLNATISKEITPKESAAASTPSKVRDRILRFEAKMQFQSSKQGAEKYARQQHQHKQQSNGAVNNVVVSNNEVLCSSVQQQKTQSGNNNIKTRATNSSRTVAFSGAVAGPNLRNGTVSNGHLPPLSHLTNSSSKSVVSKAQRKSDTVSSIADEKQQRSCLTKPSFKAYDPPVSNLQQQPHIASMCEKIFSAAGATFFVVVLLLSIFFEL